MVNVFTIRMGEYTFEAVQMIRMDRGARVAEHPIEKLRDVPRWYQSPEITTITDYVAYEAPTFRVTLLDWEGTYFDGSPKTQGGTYILLEVLRKSGEPFTLTCPAGTFENCVITSIGHSQKKPRGNQTELEVNVKQIIMPFFEPARFQYVIDTEDNTVVGIASMGAGSSFVILNTPVELEEDEKPTWAERVWDEYQEHSIVIVPAGRWIGKHLT